MVMLQYADIIICRNCNMQKLQYAEIIICRNYNMQKRQYKEDNMKLIAAVDKNWGIGNKGSLLVRIPEDMRFFKSKTVGNVVVVGRKTIDTFPGKKPLNDRVNIILTRDENYKCDGAVVVNSIEELLEKLKEYNSDDVYIIGGESIYNQMIDYCDTAYITYIDYSYESDAFFPNLEEKSDWKMIDESDEYTYFDVEYYHRTYAKES